MSATFVIECKRSDTELWWLSSDPELHWEENIINATYYDTSTEAYSVMDSPEFRYDVIDEKTGHTYPSRVLDSAIHINSYKAYESVVLRIVQVSRNNVYEEVVKVTKGPPSVNLPLMMLSEKERKELGINLNVVKVT